jgi:antitoxin (DNA-binding transcriptional repressor) of toxin-antitoxin stability system
MAPTASIRDLRNNFPRVKKLVEEEGEVVVTDQGTPKYRLTRYRPERPANGAAPQGLPETVVPLSIAAHQRYGSESAARHEPWRALSVRTRIPVRC